MRLIPCLTFAAALALPVLAQANCYSVYDAQNRLAFQSNVAPIDLSRRISDAMASRFPGSYLVMIPDESACREFRSGPVVQPRFDGLGLGASPSLGDQALQASPLLRGTRVTGDNAGPQPSDVASREAARTGTSLNIKREPARPDRNRRRGMYLPAHFAESRPEVLQAFVNAHPFGMLVTKDADGRLDSNGIPFVLDADPAGGPGILRGHVARANPLWQAGQAEGECLVVFQGPHAYVSPSWYPSKAEHGKVVPTWNYCIVQARGTLRAVESADWLHAFVTRLTDRHETDRADPWAVSDAPAGYVESMLRAIVGIEIELVALTGKWKVTQNRSAADREGVARGLADEAAGDGAELAALIRAPASS